MMIMIINYYYNDGIRFACKICAFMCFFYGGVFLKLFSATIV